MSGFRRTPLALLVVAIFSTYIAPAFAAEPQWLEIRSPHFSVVTDAGEKRGREVAVRFEQMRAVFGTLMVKAHVNLAVPLQIVAFRNKKEMLQFAPMWNGKPTQVAGLFQEGGDRNFILLDMSVNDPWKVVFHEYAHQLMNGNMTGQVDAWFEEGFAEYFSAIEVDGKEAHVGKMSELDYQIVLRRDNTVVLMPIADLFRVQHNSGTYNDSGERRSLFYAESAFVVHYLYDNQLVARLATYFSLAIDNKVPVEDAIQQTFGMTVAQFDHALRSYITSGRSRYSVLPTPQVAAARDYKVIPLDPSDSAAVLADIHLHSHDYQEKALAEFREILKLSPNHAAALRGLGYAYLQRRDFEHAGEYFRRAAEADSKDPRVHYYSALLMTRESTSLEAATLATITRELETSIALDPAFADAYALLSEAFVNSGQEDRALKAIQKAVELSPRNEQYLYDLSMTYMRSRKVDAAVAVLNGLKNSSNPELSLRAHQALAQAEDYRAAQSGSPSSADSPQPEKLGGLSMHDSTVATEAPASEPEENNNEPRQIGPSQFLKGRLVSVDCSTAPSAILTVLSGGQTWKLRIHDSQHVILIGADQFSCKWANQKVAVNYHETGKGEGSIMSLEIQ